MRKITVLLILASITNSCSQVSNIDVGNRFVDTFYSFDQTPLKTLLSSAQTSQPEILYYQKWAECANYKVIDRTKFFQKNDSTVIFPVTVKDDLMGALAIDFNVTDTFHITIKNEKIVSVKTSSNDTDDYYRAKEWVKTNRPAYVEKQCEGIWQGGPTPCECVLGMIKGFAEFNEGRGK
jgi:hypothetical protein